MKALAGVVVMWALVSCHPGAEVRAQEAPPPGTPGVVEQFLEALPPAPSGARFTELAEQHLWRLYAMPDVTRQELETYIMSGPDGPGLAYAALAVVQFHDPRSAMVMLERALTDEISTITRWYLLNVAPYALSMGDVWYQGDGALGQEERDYARSLLQFAEEAAETGLGNAHARSLSDLYDEDRLEGADLDELGLARWHQSAYLLGTLESQDYDLLEPLLTPDEGPVFRNLIGALSYSANRDFMAPLRGREPEGDFFDVEARLAAEASRWWSDYDASEEGWKAAVFSGFELVGYSISSNLDSAETRRELVRALDSGDPILLYNVFQLLNEIHGTRFDLERIFFGDKYALGPFDPSQKMHEYQAKLLAYWKDALAGD